jgi:hypothetical protein
VVRSTTVSIRTAYIFISGINSISNGKADDAAFSVKPYHGYGIDGVFLIETQLGFVVYQRTEAVHLVKSRYSLGKKQVLPRFPKIRKSKLHRRRDARFATGRRAVDAYLSATTVSFTTSESEE